MKGLFYIMLCWAVGNIISELIGNYLSGSIIGMVLMYVALRIRLFRAEDVRPAARWLLGVMALFFVPFGVGLMVAYNDVIDNIWVIVSTCVISTSLVIASVGLTFQWINSRKR